MVKTSNVSTFDVFFVKLTVHELRHSYYAMLYENGADSNFVQKQLGHSSDRTSRKIYEHLTLKIESRGIEIINKLI